MKRIISTICTGLICTGLLPLLLGGCYDSRGMDEINIVSGIAVDMEDEDFLLTLEIVDLSSDSNTGGSETTLVESRGTTIFEAVRNSKLRLYNKLYFGNLHTLIISEQLAREYGIAELLEVFLRDVEPREDIVLLISLENSARSLIASTGADTSNISLELSKIIKEDKNVAANTKSMELYQAYNTLKTPGRDLVMPAFHLTENNGEKIAELSGIAIFKDDFLKSFLPTRDMRFYLLAEENGYRGALSVPSLKNSGHMLSFEIYKSEHKTKLSYEEDRLSIHVDILIELAITEYHPLDENTRSHDDLINAAKTHVQQRVKEVFLQLQQDPGCDIYGFGELIYENQYPLWQRVKDDWDQIFQEAEMDAAVTVRIINAGLSRKGG